jgi:uncharacterized OB-fold protein
MARTFGDDWMIPALDDDNEAFYTSGKVMLQCCDDCGVFQHPPEEICPGCQGRNLGFKDGGTEGTVESFAVVHRAVHPALTDYCPYAIAVVSVTGAPGVNVFGNILNRAPHDIEIGQKVRVVFEEAIEPEIDEPLRIPQWEVV